MEKEQSIVVEKQTPADLYLMVPHPTPEGAKIVFLSVKKIKSFAGIAPTKEILATHFQAEKVRMQLAEQATEHVKEDDKKAKYMPQPLYLQIESGIFATIVAEARKKDRWVGEDALALTLGSKIPCCVISPMKDVSADNKQLEEVDKEEPEKQ